MYKDGGVSENDFNISKEYTYNIKSVSEKS